MCIFFKQAFAQLFIMLRLLIVGVHVERSDIYLQHGLDMVDQTMAINDNPLDVGYERYKHWY